MEHINLPIMFWKLELPRAIHSFQEAITSLDDWSMDHDGFGNKLCLHPSGYCYQLGLQLLQAIQPRTTARRLPCFDCIFNRLKRFTIAWGHRHSMQ